MSETSTESIPNSVVSAHDVGEARAFGVAALVRGSASLRLFCLSLGLFLAASLAAPSLAEAAETPWVDLRWTAPEACPSQAEVLAEIDRLLGGRAARPATPIEASALVAQREGGFVLHLDVAADTGERARDLGGASCAAIADATALILAMMIDETAALAGPDEPEAGGRSAPADPPKEPEPAPPQAPSAPSAPVEEPSAPLAISLRGLVFAGADLGSLPGVSGRIGASLGVLVGDQRFEAGFALAPGSTTTVAGRPGAGGDLALAAGNVGTCRRLLDAPVELSPCVSFELGSLSASGFGVSSPGEGSALWAAAILGFSGAYSLSETVALESRIEGALPLLRPRFVLDGVGAVHRASAAAGRAHLGVELRF